MKELFAIAIACQILLACGSKTSDSSSDNAPYDSLGVSDMPSYDYEQGIADKFLHDFNTMRHTSDSIAVRASSGLGSDFATYYYQNGDLFFIEKQLTGEGGFWDRTLMMIGEEGVEVGFNINDGADGWFTFIGISGREWFKTGLNTKRYDLPVIDGASLEVSLVFREELDLHLRIIAENKNQFTRQDGVRQFYLPLPSGRKKLYIVSEKLLERDYLKGSAIQKNLIAFYLNEWRPLFDGPNGLERHTLCGSEEYIVISEREGKYSWRDQGTLDGVEWAIVGFEEGEGDSMTASLQSPFGTRTLIVVYNETEKLLYIDRKPHTANPSRYKIVDDSGNCTP